MAHRVRHGGTWRNTTQPSIRHGGTWRAATAAWIRHGGIWRQWWPDLPDRGGPYLFGAFTSVGPRVAKWDGSAWVSVGGGLTSNVGSMVVNDAGKLLASVSGTTSRYFDGSSWSTVNGSFYGSATAGIATDGTDFYIARYTPGADPTVYSFTGSTWASLLYPTYSGGTATISALAYGADGGYLEGTFDSPDNAPLAWDSGSSASSSLLSSRVMARQLDGLVWTGPASGGVIAREDGSGLDGWEQVGGTVSGGNVDAICAIPGKAWVGGTFTDIDGETCSGLAEWDGSTWNAVGSLGTVMALAYHQGILWILAGTAVTAEVYTWDGTTLSLNSDWTGEVVYGLC
jgi:hypothetical protein